MMTITKRASAKLDSATEHCMVTTSHRTVSNNVEQRERMMGLVTIRSLWAKSKKGTLIRYLIVGTANTLAGNAIFWLIWNLIGGMLGFLISSVVSFFLSVLVSFLSHSFLVFEVSDRLSRRLVRFILSQTLNLGIFLTTITFLHQQVSLGPYVSYFLGSCLVIAVGLLVNSKWVFAK